MLKRKLAMVTLGLLLPCRVAQRTHHPRPVPPDLIHLKLSRASADHPALINALADIHGVLPEPLFTHPGFTDE